MRPLVLPGLPAIVFGSVSDTNAGSSLVPGREDPSRPGMAAALTRVISRIAPKNKQEGQERVHGFSIRSTREGVHSSPSCPPRQDNAQATDGQFDTAF